MSKTTRIREIEVGTVKVPVHACGSCDAEILWATTARGKALCLDLEPSDKGTYAVKLHRTDENTAKVLCFYRPLAGLLEPGEKRRTSHWGTCPNAEQHRRKADV